MQFFRIETLIKIGFFVIAVIVFFILYTFLKEPTKLNSKKFKTNSYLAGNQINNATAPIEPADIVDDKNDIHMLHAQANGLKKPFATNAEFEDRYKSLVSDFKLVEIKDCRLYHLKSLKHSHPYLIPEAVYMLNELAIRFQRKLKEKDLGNYCFFLTSVLRTQETQQNLSKRNGNAAEMSSHFYGTTMDISYKHFLNLDNDSIVPSWEIIQELMHTVVEMRKECKLLAVRERKQSCFHITVVCGKPNTKEN